MIDKKKYKGSAVNNIFNDIDDISDEDKKILSKCLQAYSDNKLKQYDKTIDEIDNKVKNRIHKLLNEENINFEGMDGKFSFKKNIISRELEILKISNGKAILLE